MKQAQSFALVAALALSAAALLVSLRDHLPAAGTRPPEPGIRGERTSTSPAETRSTRGSADIALEERIARLERRLLELEKGRTAGTTAADPASPEAIAEAKSLVSMAVDTALHPSTRITALKKLRKSAPASREGAVTASLVTLLRATEDPSTRTEIIRHLYGVRDPLLKEELLYRLRADPDADVRDEAAESLEIMLDDPAVVSELEWARDHDTDEGVRARAAKSLAGPDPAGGVR